MSQCALQIYRIMRFGQSSNCTGRGPKPALYGHISVSGNSHRRAGDLLALRHELGQHPPTDNKGPEMHYFSGQAAIVTGGASGLGAAAAAALRNAGLHPVLFDLNVDAGLAKAADLGGLFVKVDVSDPDSVSAGIVQAEATFGALRVLVNCAGLAPAAKTVARGAAHDAGLFARTIAVNLIGSFNCASQVAARMVAADPLGPDGARGVIVNTASVAAYDGQVGQVAYAASKAGIVGMTLPMARDLADKGIRVCTIAPGLFLTPLLQGLPTDVQSSLGAQVPYPPRLGDPTEYAALVRHIVENPMLNGEVIRLDGAIRMAAR